jgi:hypothetical protein
VDGAAAPVAAEATASRAGAPAAGATGPLAAAVVVALAAETGAAAATGEEPAARGEEPAAAGGARPGAAAVDEPVAVGDEPAPCADRAPVGAAPLKGSVFAPGRPGTNAFGASGAAASTVGAACAFGSGAAFGSDRGFITAAIGSGAAFGVDAGFASEAWGDAAAGLGVAVVCRIGAACGMGAAFDSCSTSGGGAEEPATASALVTLMRWPHLRHFIRTERPATFSSAIWYFALQLGQRNFIQPDAVGGRAMGSTENTARLAFIRHFSARQNPAASHGRPVSPSGRQAARLTSPTSGP